MIAQILKHGGVFIMRVKKAIRKVAALMAGASMVGATII